MAIYVERERGGCTTIFARDDLYQPPSVGRTNIKAKRSLPMTEKRECGTCRFAERLEEELRWRYNCTDVDTASPSTILLAVLNAVAEARRQPIDAEIASADREDICGGCGLPLLDHYKGERCPSK